MRREPFATHSGGLTAMARSSRSAPADTEHPDSAEQDPIRLAPRPRIVDEVLHRIRESILNHEIPPGARLVQTELAERLGVSRTPLREAIRLLEQDGLVRVADGNRTVEVIRLSRQDIVELYAIREVIDGLAARTLAQHGMDDVAREAIVEHLARMEQATDPFRGEDYFVAHVNFHASIIEHCGNRWLRSQLPLVRVTAASLRDQFPRFVRESSRTSASAARQTARVGQQEHENIFEAMRDGNGDEAERAARLHIANAAAFFPDK
jgi:GntR family transcriptional regulator, vanillate catabolism transcriptional regulator